MVKLSYKFDKTTLEALYLDKLFSTKFGRGKNALTVKDKFDKLKAKYPYSVIFCDISFNDIIFVEPEKIKSLIYKIEHRIVEQSKIKYKQEREQQKFIYEAKDELKKVFKYENKFQEVISNFFEKELKTKICYYCNIHYVNEYKVDEEEYKNEFTLDHYYDKGSYPYLALSLYNLIPSCYVCNSKLKKTIELDVLPPNSKDFDFDKIVKFKLFLSSSCKNLNIKSKDDIEIPLKEKYSDKYNKYIKLFKLNERYSAHKDIVYEMMKNAELYPESRLKELQELTGIPYQQIKKDIFKLIDEEADLSKEPFSKLIKDISQELGL